MIQKRPDIAVKIHKAIRKTMFELGLAAGRTNFADEAEVAALRPRVEETVGLLRMHGHKEDEFALPMIAEHAPDIVAHDSGAHVVIDADIDALERAYAAVAADGIDAGERDARGEAFFNALNRFIGNYMLHMHDEETVTAAKMWEVLSDDELIAMTQKIVGSMTPGEMMLSMKHMMPAINTPEREELLGAIAAAAPPEVYEKIASFAVAPSA